MPQSPSSTVQIARKALARQLREMRLDAGLSARDVASRVGWYPSKCSRLETGTTPPSDADIRAWCEACGADEEKARDLIAASRSAESLYVEWKRLQRNGLRRLQESRIPLYNRTRLFRVYCSTVVPGLFQTAAYATALLTSISDFHAIPNDVEDAVLARAERSMVVHDGKHRIVVLIEESVLRNVFGSREGMAEQLDYLLAAAGFPSVSLGVIPGGAQRRMWTLETFTIFDDIRAHVELLTGKVTLTARGDVEQYVRAFEELSRLAVYGGKAAALIKAARPS